MMYTIRSRKLEPTPLPTEGIFNLAHYIGMARDDTMGKWIAAQLNVMAGTAFIPLSTGSLSQCFNQLSFLPTLPSPEEKEGWWVEKVGVLKACQEVRKGCEMEILAGKV